MHSFTSSLSFLLLASLLALLNYASESAAQPAPGELAPPRGLGHAAHVGASYRRRGAAHARASTDLLLYPGRRAAGASFTYFKTGL